MAAVILPAFYGQTDLFWAVKHISSQWDDRASVTPDLQILIPDRTDWQRQKPGATAGHDSEFP